MDKKALQLAHNYQLKHDIDSIKAKELLDDIIECLENVKLVPLVVFGTSLGFYRSGDFIPHDLDVDVAVFNCTKDSIPLDSIKSRGIIHSREMRDLYSFTRDMINLDLYLFNIDGKGWYHCKPGIDHYKIKESEFENRGIIKCMSTTYNIPGNPEQYFERLYGKDWKTPIQGKHAKC